MAQIIEIEGDRVFTSKTIFNELITNGSAVSPINTFSGDGSQVTFILSKTPFDSANLSVIVDDTPMIQDTDYTYEVVSDNPTITFTTAPSSGTDNIVIGETFTYEPNKYKYYLAAHYYDSDEVDALLQDKVDIEQGSTNANKLVATDSNGDIKAFTDIPTLTGRTPLDLSNTVTNPTTLTDGAYDVTTGGYIGNSSNNKMLVVKGSIFYLFNDSLALIDTNGSSAWIEDITDNPNYTSLDNYYTTLGEVKAYVNDAIGDIDTALTTIVSGGGV